MSKLSTMTLAKAAFAGGVALAALVTAGNARAQTAPDPQAPGAPLATTPATDSPGAAIIVTGTRRTDRSVVDSASPIDVIGAAELTNQPAANLLDVVRNLVPSFFVPQNTISDASSFVRAPSLRGLSADEVLVLINGKRYNRSALVQVYTGGETALSYGSQGADISQIPAIAIKNLQILRDGATAQYGSDAIAGVLNYAIRDDAGFELQARYGQFYEGDGESYQIAGNAGIKLGEFGFINVSGEYFNDGQTTRNATRPIALQFAAANPGLANQLPNFPGPVQIFGSSPQNGYKLFLNSAIGLGANSRLYLTVNVSHSDADQSFNYRSPINAITPFVVNDGSGTPATRSPGRNVAFNPIFLTRCPQGNATCPAGGFVRDANIFNFSTVYPAGFTPRFLGTVDQAWGTIGIKGRTDGGLTYDISGTVARASLDLGMRDSLNSSFGPQSQTSFRFGKLIQTETNGNLDLTYPLNIGLASPVTLSLDAEYRREQYQQTVGDAQSYSAGPFAVQNLFRQTAPGVFVADGQVTKPVGASGYAGTSPDVAGVNSQESFGISVGAEADITNRLSAGVAGRYESYNTFGDAIVGKFNVLWKAIDLLSLRATVGSGFHAPSPGQNNTQIVTTTFVGGDQVQTGTYSTQSPVARYFGATTLGPERSFNLGAGFVLKPSTKFTVTVDGYSIRVTDRIGISRNFTVSAANLAEQPLLATVGVGGVVNYFTNGFNTQTYGIDVVANYRTRLIGGPLAVTVAYNFNRTGVFDGDALSRDQVVNINNLAPNHRVNASANWQIGKFTINARENYYGENRNENDYPSGIPGRLGQVFGAKFTTDLDISYTFMERFTLTAGGLNIFDTYPDRIAPTTVNPVFAVTGSLADGQIYPRNGGPFGINGGFWYVRARVKY